MTRVLAWPTSELTLREATWMLYQGTGNHFNSWLFFWNMNNGGEKQREPFVSHKPWIWCIGLWFKWSPGSMVPASHLSLSEEDIPMFCVAKCVFGGGGGSLKLEGISWYGSHTPKIKTSRWNGNLGGGYMLKSHFSSLPLSSILYLHSLDCVKIWPAAASWSCLGFNQNDFFFLMRDGSC